MPQFLIEAPTGASSAPYIGREADFESADAPA